ncbi:MAG: head GIN domain-containing protein [Bacteroidia bacterium]
MRRLLRVLFYGTLILIGMGVYFAKKNNKDLVKGNGVVVSDTRASEEFEHIRIGGAFEVMLRQGSGYSVDIEADENLQDHIVTDVSNQTLDIHTEGHIGKFEKMKVTITAPKFSSVETSGGVVLSSDNQLSGTSLKVKASGASKVNLDIAMESIHSEFSGAGDITFSGEAASATVNISGAGKLRAYDLKTHEMHVSISGAGYAEVNADQKLDLNVSGAGKVNYKGNPSDVSKSISGAGHIEAVN